MCSVKSPRFRATRYFSQIILGLLVSLPVTTAALNFDILNNCSEISQLYQSLRSNSPFISGDCRPAHTVFERTIISRTGPQTQIQLCILDHPPAMFLNGYTCLKPIVAPAVRSMLDAPSTEDLVCFRKASSADIDEYKERYKEQYSAIIIHYLEAASACSASSRDSSVAYTGTFPYPLNFVSRYEFGFLVKLAEAPPAESYLQHGYASVDPSTTGGEFDAIEFVHMLVSASPNTKSEIRKEVDDWTVYINDAKEFNSLLNSEARRLGADIFVNYTFINIERHSMSEPGPSLDEKLLLLDSWQQVIADVLDAQGFDVVPEHLLRAKTGKSSEQTIEEVNRNMPFAWRDKLPKKLGRKLFVLINQDVPSCTHRRGSGMGAYIMSMEPTPEVSRDYGGIALVLAGSGSCGHYSGTTIDYVQGLIDEATTSILQEIGRQ